MADKIYTVNQVNRYLKQRFEDDVVLQNIMIKGEISNFKLHSSGHCYFTLKDNLASIKCVAFRSNAMRFRFCPQNGMKIIASGYLSVYERDGAYQLYVQTLSPEGIGDLAVAFEQLKNKLALEGLFDPEHKQELPFYARKIGVVTAKTGAVIKDICHVSKRRNPLVKIMLYSVLVQGENASQDIVKGIEFFNKKCPVDIIIVGRGGGSLEDLWAFNEENVVRAIFNSKIPIISAVGHETDYTLSDMVSDVRAATPSQAAELAVVERVSLINYIENLVQQLRMNSCNELKNKQNKLDLLLKHSILQNKEKLLQPKQQQLDLLHERLINISQQKYLKKLHQNEILIEKLKILNPLNVLNRGFSVVKQEDKYIKSAFDVDSTKDMEIIFSNGKIRAKVIK